MQPLPHITHINEHLKYLRPSLEALEFDLKTQSTALHNSLIYHMSKLKKKSTVDKVLQEDAEANKDKMDDNDSKSKKDKKRSTEDRSDNGDQIQLLDEIESTDEPPRKRLRQLDVEPVTTPTKQLLPTEPKGISLQNIWNLIFE